MKEYNARVAATMGWGRGNCYKRRRGGGARVLPRDLSRYNKTGRPS